MTDKFAEAIERQTQVLAQLVAQGQNKKEVGGPYVTKAASGHSGTLLHGAGGMFNTPGLSEAIISTHVPAQGLGQLLPAYPSNVTHPWFGFLTGFGNESGAEPTNPCDDAPTGYMKTGTLTARFGHIARDTQTIRLPDTITKLNRGDFTDLQLVNSILNPDSSGVFYPNDISEQGVLDMVTRAEQVIVGVNMERKLSNLLWSGIGTGANDTPGGGYKEFPGLDVQVATGQLDAETGAAMASADSLILSFGYKDVASSNIVDPIQKMESYMYALSLQTGIGPVEWVLVMRPELWEAISSVWPIQYNTQPDMSTLDANRVRVLLDARANIDQRDMMRAGLYLDINGRRYNVVLDNMIPMENNAAVGLGVDEFASAVYFLPLRVIGGLPVLYWEYLDHNLSVPQTSLLHGLETWYSDGGRFLWSYDGKFTCFKMKAETDPRVVLRTPHLAWKLEDVKFTNFIPHRDPDPTSDYWKNGGVSLRTIGGPTQYGAWL